MISLEFCLGGKLSLQMRRLSFMVAAGFCQWRPTMLSKVQKRVRGYF